MCWRKGGRAEKRTEVTLDTGRSTLHMQVITNADSSIGIWNVFTGYRRHRVKNLQDSVFGVGVFPSAAKVVAFAENAAEVAVYRIGTCGKLLRRLPQGLSSNIASSENSEQQYPLGGTVASVTFASIRLTHPIPLHPIPHFPISYSPFSIIHFPTDRSDSRSCILAICSVFFFATGFA